jgi:hypothetical protein
MPFFGRQGILTRSATSSGANWSAYTGANDVEYTISDCSGIIGFKEFDSTRGILVTFQDVGGQPGYDLVHVRLVTLDPSANTLTFGSKINHGISNQGFFDSQGGFLQKTTTDTIVLETNDNDGTSRSYRLVDGVLTQSAKFSNEANSNGPGGYRNTDGDFIQVNSNRSIKKIGLASTNTNNPTSTLIASQEFSAHTSDQVRFGDSIYGFADKNTILAFQDVGTDLMEVKKYDVTAGSTSAATISGLGTVAFTLQTSGVDNITDFDKMGMNVPFETTDFNDTAVMIERLGQSPNNQMKFHTYKNGDGVYKSVSLTQAGIGNCNDASAVFLGSTNSNLFIYSRALTSTSPTRKQTYFTIDLNLLENTVRVIVPAEINEFEGRYNMFRFGNDRGLYNYQSNKLWLMVP